MTGAPDRTVIIGAGLGGLSAACHLAGRGHEVVVLEAGDGPGGRAGRLQLDGYAFDTGPTVLTMPHLIDRCFEAAGVDGRDLLDLRPVDPMYRACFADGSELRVRHGRAAMTEEIRRVCGAEAAAAFGPFCDHLTELYELEQPNFIERSFDGPLDLVRPLRPALELVRLGGFGRLHKVVARAFEDERLRKLFSFQALYAGLAPYEALALYGVITYMDTVNGVYVPRGGMHAVAEALATAAEKAGATFRYGAKVDRIVLRDGTSGPVRGVRLGDGELVEATHVVANPDLPVVYRTLLPGLRAPLGARRGSYSPSALVWLVGARGSLPEGAEHHNIHFGHEWEGAFRALLRDGRRMPDPSLLVTVLSHGEPDLAPPGAHALYVLEPVPNLGAHIDWTRERSRARDDLLGHLDRLGYPTDVEVEQLIDPLDWEAQGMERGTPFALSHKFRHTGPFRPGNLDRRVPGLVFVGSGTQPGVGVPMVLVSGMLAAQRVEATRVKLDVDDPALIASYATCKELTRRSGTTYYWSTYLLPARSRPHVWALYAFCRLADDVVDDLDDRPVTERVAALAALEERFFHDLERGESDDPALQAVVRTVRELGLDAGCFERFLRSMAQDLTVTRYETWDDLLDYMDGSAAVIGEMMLPVLEPTDPVAAFGPARDLGLAFQLTNFLRDVDEDLDRGRVYLPQEDLRRFGADPWRRQVDDAWIALARFEVERCRELYRSAEAGLAVLPPASRRCVMAAHRLYSQILERIEARGYDVFTGRARVPTSRKVLTSARIALLVR